MVGLVAVHEPLRRTQMQLYVAHPQRGADAYLGVEEVGPGIAVVQSGVYHLHGLALCGGERCQGEEAVLPYVVQELFHIVRRFRVRC